MAYAWLIGSIVFAGILWFALSGSTSNRAPLPPGPKGLPLLGNLNDLPKPGVLEAHHWLKHKDLYGLFCLERKTIQQEELMLHHE